MTDPPLYIDPFVGWRAWKVERTSDRIFLRSWYYGMKWPHRKPMRAHCLYAWATKKPVKPIDHSAPDVHGCGVYGLRTPHAVLKMLPIQPRKDEIVIGTVRLWGQMLEGSRGWQAEFGYPDELFVMHDDNPALAGDIAHDLHVAYGVEVAARPFSTPW